MSPLRVGTPTKRRQAIEKRVHKFKINVGVILCIHGNTVAAIYIESCAENYQKRLNASIIGKNLLSLAKETKTEIFSQ